MQQVLKLGRDKIKLGSAREIDRPLFLIIGIIIIAGLFIFTSASFGLIGRENFSFGKILFTQLGLGLGGGLVAAFFFYKFPYQYLRRFAFYFFVLTLLIGGLVFVPEIGREVNGARSWISLGLFSFQPAELIKFAFILFSASWFASIGEDIRSWRYGVLPLLLILGVVAALFFAQPDHGTFVAIFATAIAMAIVSNIRLRDLIIILVICAIALGAIFAFKPYVIERLTTFLNPDKDPLGASYQLRQSLIAIGSGEITGRGFGQSIQKFNFLPEPIGDSIFAVFAEEFGFVGGLILIILFFLFAIRGLNLARRSSDQFARLTIIGIVIMIVSQSYLNIGAMVGVFPLTGVPLLFVSHGGTALLFAMAEVGLLLQLSRYTK